MPPPPPEKRSRAGAERLSRLCPSCSRWRMSSADMSCSGVANWVQVWIVGSSRPDTIGSLYRPLPTPVQLWSGVSVAFGGRARERHMGNSPWARGRNFTYRYHLWWQRLVMIFRIGHVSAIYFDMIALSGWQLKIVMSSFMPTPNEMRSVWWTSLSLQEILRKRQYMSYNKSLY